MKRFPLFILLFSLAIIFIGILLFYKKEAFTVPETLRNPAHLPANVRRPSNTILTATATFSDDIDTLTLPATVADNFNEWIEKGFISPVKDQMLCGGCWAFATCGSLADRLTIATNGKWMPAYGLSEQVLISCGGTLGMQFYQGCEGGIPHSAIDALSTGGIPEDVKCSTCGGASGASSGGGGSGGVVNPNNTTSCSSGGNSYASTNYTWWQSGCDSATSCSLSPASTCPCDGITSQFDTLSAGATKFKTAGEAHGYTTHGDNDEIETVDLWPNISADIIAKNVDRMKKAIYFEGPITVGYRVTNDFYTFWPTSSADNYYQYDGSSAQAGGHAVIIVGWKKLTDGTPVWIVKNSWGENAGYGFSAPNWSDPSSGATVAKYRGGFWNHRMGINDSFIESNASGAHPDLTVAQIAPLVPAGLPADWWNTMTLRDIYLQHSPTPSQPTPPAIPAIPAIPAQPTQSNIYFWIGFSIFILLIFLAGGIVLFEKF